MTGDDTGPIRLDKWLWAARFFKTRSQASQAIKGGHVHANGQRGKAGMTVRIGDRLAITKGVQHFEIDVLALSDKRGPASRAQALYAETEDSVAAREQVAAERRAAMASMPRPQRRPDKRDRRHLHRFKRQQ